MDIFLTGEPRFCSLHNGYSPGHTPAMAIHSLQGTCFPTALYNYSTCSSKSDANKGNSLLSDKRFWKFKRGAHDTPLQHCDPSVRSTTRPRANAVSVVEQKGRA